MRSRERRRAPSDAGAAGLELLRRQSHPRPRRAPRERLPMDTGVQVRTGNDLLDGMASVTTGRCQTGGGRRQRRPADAGRAALHPIAGLVLGGSAARGAFASRSPCAPSPDARGGDFTQIAWGAEIEFSRDYSPRPVRDRRHRWMLPVGRPFRPNCPLLRSRHTRSNIQDRPGFMWFFVERFISGSVRLTGQQGGES
jgi:hypothetical protein